VLILSRQTKQRIIIQGQIIVEVIEIIGDKVKLGISAPKDVTIHREEVQLRIERGEPTRRART
jgi:carbon storage regulator